MKDNETPALAAAEAQRKLDEKKKQETTALIVLGCIAAVVVVVLLIVGFVIFSVMKKKRLSAEIAEANKREQELDARAGSSDNSDANATNTNAAFTDSEEDDVETGAAVVGGTAVQGARKVAGDGIDTAETSAAQGVVPKGGELSGEENAASIATTSVRTCAAEGSDETQVDLAAHKSMPPPTASKAGGSGETHVEPAADPTKQLTKEEPSIAADGIGEKNETEPDVSTVDVEAAAGDAAAAVPVLTATDPPDEEGSATSTPPSASAPAEEAEERIE